MVVRSVNYTSCFVLIQLSTVYVSHTKGRTRMERGKLEEEEEGTRNREHLQVVKLQLASIFFQYHSRFPLIQWHLFWSFSKEIMLLACRAFELDWTYLIWRRGLMPPRHVDTLWVDVWHSWSDSWCDHDYLPTLLSSSRPMLSNKVVNNTL